MLMKSPMGNRNNVRALIAVDAVSREGRSRLAPRCPICSVAKKHRYNQVIAKFNIAGPRFYCITKVMILGLLTNLFGRNLFLNSLILRGTP